MNFKKKIPSWLSILLLSGLGISVGPHQVLTRTSEVSRTLNPVLSNYEVLRFEPGDIEQQVRTTGELRFRFQRTDFHFNLEPHNMRAPGYRATATGSGGVRRTLPPQPVHTYKGRLSEREDTEGRFNLTDDGVEGVVYAPEGWYYVEPLRNYLPSALVGELVVYRQADIKPGESLQCDVSLPQRLQRGVARVEAQAQAASSTDLTNYVADVATEADYEYVQKMGGAVQANRNIEGILNHVEGAFQYELLVQLRISFQHAWETEEDPYTGTTLGRLLIELRSYWYENFAAAQDYDILHLWTGKFILELDGKAGGLICQTRNNDAVSVSEHQNYMPSNYYIPAHEIGHNLGASHPYEQNPPVATCYQTVMSLATEAVTFCQFSRDEIAEHLSLHNSCLDTQPITLQPPSGLTAAAASATGINLAWQDNSTSETGFIVERRRLGSGKWVRVGTTAAEIEAFASDGLFPNATYIYRVQAFNSSGTSAYSNEAAATTLAGTFTANNWTINTYAGRTDNDGDNGPAVRARLALPEGVAVDHSGNVYVSEYWNNRIRRVDRAGTITTYAGTGKKGYSGDGAPAVAAQFDGPVDLAVDDSGNLYIADSGNNRVRRVDTSGIITTVAGTGEEGYSGDGGPAVAAELDGPSGVAVDGSGTIYISDTSNQRVRRVNNLGTITTIAGIGGRGYGGNDGKPAVRASVSWPRGLAVDGAGNVYIAASGDSRILRVDTSGIITTVAGTGEEGYSGDGGPAVDAGLSNPYDVAVDGAGNLYIPDGSNHRVRRVDASGTITTIAGQGEGGYSGDGGPAVRARLDLPTNLTVDGSGNLLIVDARNNRIRRVDTSGTITTVAGIGESGFSGDGGQAVSAWLYDPAGIAFDKLGNLYIADRENNRIRRVDTSGAITTVAGTGERGYSGDGGPAVSAQLGRPASVAVDSSGNLYIGDDWYGHIRRVDASGTITTIVPNLNDTRGLAVDGSGNLYIAQFAHSKILRLDTSGTITTVAGTGEEGYGGDGGPAVEARLDNPGGVAVDGSGNLYIADTFNHRIRRVDTAGTITTIAGIGRGIDNGGTGPATEAVVRTPYGVAVDGTGNLYIAGGGRIKRVDASGIITSIAGTGRWGYSGDGGPGVAADLFYPHGIAVDISGNVYFSDRGNHRIRVLKPGTTPPGGMPGPGDEEVLEPEEDPSDFTGADLEGRRLMLEETGGEAMARGLRVRFLEGNRFQAEDGNTATRLGRYAYQQIGSGEGRLSLNYDDGVSCEISLSFGARGDGAFSYGCSDGTREEGRFRLTTGSLFVPVILSSAGRNNSLFTSELALTNRGVEAARLNYTYTAHSGGGSGTASGVIEAGRQKVEPDALGYLRRLGIPIPHMGNRIGTLRVEVPITADVGAIVRTMTAVPEGRVGLAYPGIPEEEGFEDAVFLCGLRQNSHDRSNVAIQNAGGSTEGDITLRVTVFSGDPASVVRSLALPERSLPPGGFHQYNGILDMAGFINGYVKVERVDGKAPFYAYGVINDNFNSDGSFVFPVREKSLAGATGQTLPVVIERAPFVSELMVTNFSDEPQAVIFSVVDNAIEAADDTATFSLPLSPGQQYIIPNALDAARQQFGINLPSGLAVPLFAKAVGGDMSGIVIGARTGSQADPGDKSKGQYSVFYTAVPDGAAFSSTAWVYGLQQNAENRSNLALVNTGEFDGSPSIFNLEIYNGETGQLHRTITGFRVEARRWRQIDSILLNYAPEATQGYVRIYKTSGNNPFLAYGVINDGGARLERSDDGAYVPARE